MALIEAKSLVKTYGKGDTAITALDHLSVAIDSGEFVAVMGPSGCGKSTLLHLMGGLDRPDGGSVFIDGTDISKLNDTKLAELRRHKLGFIFQFFNLIPVLTAIENASLPLMLDGVSASEARQKAGEWLKRMGLDQRLNNRPDQLSGGQQQRVAIARALAADPALILADEPTGNLDSRSSDEIAGLLRQISDDYGRTVLMVTHDPRIAAYADRILFLKDGKLVDETRLNNGDVDQARILRDKIETLSQH